MPQSVGSKVTENGNFEFECPSAEAAASPGLQPRSPSFPCPCPLNHRIPQLISFHLEREKSNISPGIY